MAIKELFYDQRPVALLNPRASQRIDPRFKFTRNSIGTRVAEDGYIASVGNNIPRIDYDPVTGSCNGMIVEPSTFNSVLTSNVGLGVLGTAQITVTSINSIITPDGKLGPCLNVSHSSTQGNSYMRRGGAVAITAGKRYTVSVFVRNPNGHPFEQSAGGTYLGIHLYRNGTSQNANVGFGSSAMYKKDYANGWRRYAATFTANDTATVDGIFSVATFVPTYLNWQYQLWGFQIEEGDYVTSYIPTSGSQVTRSADLLSVENVTIPASGSVYIDARSLSTELNSTLLSLKNASNQKLNLAMEERSELYNSLALTYSIKGTVKPTLPYPVPTTNRERNIITWGTNNYQYNTDGARFAPSLSTTPGIPADLTQLSIGHDAVDPTKAFNGYINAVYLYNGEIAPTVAEALVRGELDPINADTYSPVGPTGSLALIINTQGASSSGDKVFALPAESALNDNDIVITWGDGTESGLDGAAAELGAPGLEHTYPSAGIYPVWVEGQLENLKFNNSASAPDLVKIEAWGTTANGNDVFLSPSTMNSAFYGCSKLQSMPTSGLPDTSAVSDWTAAFQGCSSLTGTFPSFNFSAATTLSRAFFGCSGLTSFTAAGDQTQNVTNFYQAWYDCSGLTSFPLINTSSATSLSYAWYNCTGLTSIFPTINTANVTNFSGAWYNCSGFTEFPLLNTSSGTNMDSTWRGCTDLASFPLLNTSAVSNFGSAWYACSSLNNIGVVPGATTSFPLIDTAAGTNFSFTWFNCTSLTNFPLINTSAGTNFSYAWHGCTSLTSFPEINTSAGTNFYLTWRSCNSLTSFPLIDTAAGTNFSSAWYGCSSLNNIGVVPGATTSFPLINTAAGTNFARTWQECYSLTAFPALNFGSATGSASDASNTYTGFRNAWRFCSSLTDFPANRFNTTTCTRYLDAWTSCALTAQSIENILVSINTANTSNGNLGIGGGTNAAKTTWSSAANTAYDALVARGWTITFNA